MVALGAWLYKVRFEEVGKIILPRPKLTENRRPLLFLLEGGFHL